jgi:hypothetical protein
MPLFIIVANDVMPEADVKDCTDNFRDKAFEFLPRQRRHLVIAAELVVPVERIVDGDLALRLCDDRLLDEDLVRRLLGWFDEFAIHVTTMPVLTGKE